MINSQKAFNACIFAVYFIVKLHEVLWLQRVQYVYGLMQVLSSLEAVMGSYPKATRVKVKTRVIHSLVSVILFSTAQRVMLQNNPQIATLIM